MQKVLITRDAAKAAFLIDLLAQHGVTGIPFPVTEIRAIPQLHPLPNFSDFNGIVFTSATAVKISGDLFASVKTEMTASMKWFAVGEKTASAIDKCFGKSPEIIGSIGGEELAKQIFEKFGNSISLILWPCANEVAFNIKESLHFVGIECIPWVVYETNAMPEEDLRKQCPNFSQIDAIFFAAPSAVYSLSRLESAKAIPGIAIGGLTNQAMGKCGWRNITQADTPTESAILEAILSCLQHN